MLCRHLYDKLRIEKTKSNGGEGGRDGQRPDSVERKTTHAAAFPASLISGKSFSSPTLFNAFIASNAGFSYSTPT